MNKPVSSPADPVLRPRGPQILAFALVGLAGTALHYGIYLILVLLLEVPPGISAFAGAAAGACVVYLLNRRYTFASQRSHAETIPRFVILSLLGAVLNGAIVGWLSNMGVHFLLAQMIATVLVLFINFVVSKKWIFR